MSVQRPGIAKSSQALVFKRNENKQTSLSGTYSQGTAARPRTTISANLNNINSRMQVFTSDGAMVSLNPRQALRNANPMLMKADNSAMRAGFNQNKGFDIAYMKEMQKAYESQARYENKQVAMATALAMVMNLSEMTQAIVKEVNDAKTTSTPQSTKSRMQNSNILDGSGFSSKLSNLSNDTDFSEINDLQKQVDAKKDGLSTTYKDADVSASINTSLSAVGVQEGLELAGLKDFKAKTEDLGLQNLDATNLADATATVDKDIKELNDFISTDLDAAKTKISAKSGEIKGSLEATTKSIEEIELQIATAEKAGEDVSALKTKLEQYKQQEVKLKKQQAQVKAAETALTNIETVAKESVGKLNDVKSEIKDIQNFESQVQDKKFTMAKNQDQQLGRILNQLARLDKNIQKRGDSSDRLNKRSELLSQLDTLTSSLQDAGATEFTNSKNSKYELKNLTAALNYQNANAISVKANRTSQTLTHQNMSDPLGRNNNPLPDIANVLPQSNMTNEEVTNMILNRSPFGTELS